MESKSLYAKIQLMKQNPETANMGKRWASDEVTELLQEVKDKQTFKNIAIKHKRTEGSILSKLLTIAESYIRDGKNINEVSKIVNRPVSIIEEHMKTAKPKKIKQEIIIENENENEKEEDEPSEITLNEEQQKALDLWTTGKNIFLTGYAGTGKSVTVKKIIEYCKSENKKFGVTATTGSAAFLIGGKTIHSFLGIGLAKESAEELKEKVFENKMFYVIKKLKDLDILIIDEISMLDNELFDKISKYLSLIRKNSKPFGGLQVLLTGDFCQLEPVEGTYCFKAEDWSKLEMEIIYLKNMIRQNKDKEFQKILLELRNGNCSNETYEKLFMLKDKEFGEIKPTKLYPLNYDVDKVNLKEYNLLIESGAKKVTYERTYQCLSKDKEKTVKWADNIGIPEAIELCIGAQVVVITNIDQEKGIVNGTRGIITEVKPKSVTIKRVNGKLYEVQYCKSVNAENSAMALSYMPLKLAYALTIHKSQGMSLDAVEIDIGPKIFAKGQAYTAISRARNLNSIKIKDISKDSFITSKSVLKFYSKLT